MLEIIAFGNMKLAGNCEIIITMNFEGMYGGFHLIYLFLFSLLLLIEILYLRKKDLNDKTIDLIIRVSGVILLLLVTINRIAIVSWNIQNASSPEAENPHWWCVIPDTWCSFSAYVLGFSALFGKRNNITLHFAVYTSTFGCIMCMFLPFFLNIQGFWEPRSLFGMLHHSWAFHLIIFLFMKGEFMPSKKKTLAFLAGAAIMMGLGYFEIYVMGYDHSMQIGDPFVQASPFLSILTSWYSSLLALFLLALGAGAIGDAIKKKSEAEDKQ